MSETGTEEGAATCGQCGTPMPSGSLSDVCPPCLLKRTRLPGLSPSDPSEFQPLSEAELSELMDGYEVIGLINRGGMGAVYRAVQLNLDRPVAIKLLPLEVAADPEFEDRFGREAKTMARLDHPNIVRIYEFGDIEGQFYFVMEFVDGRDLAQFLRAGTPPVEEAFDLMLQIGDALAYAHQNGIIHRDIKPGNVLLTGDGRAKLTDFGLAKIAEPDDDSHDITRTQASLGTPHYMAPELHRNSNTADARADIYSFGVLCYELLTGKLPIGKFQPPSELAPVGVDIDRAVLRALHSDPDKRYQAIAEFKDELADAIRQSQRAGREKITAVLLFTDVVDSVGLNTRLGTEAYVKAIEKHDAVVKSVLDTTGGAKVLQHAGDGFLIRVAHASEGVAAALRIQYLMSTADWGGEAPQVRIGLHLGEVVEITEHNTGVTKPVGLAINIAARIASLASGGQILMSRVIFDEARQYLKQHPAAGGDAEAEALPLVWPAHGRYLFKGSEEAIEIYEVGAEGIAPLAPPPDNDKAKRAVAADEEQTLGWRPGVGIEIPGRSKWVLEEKVGEGGFGEVWLAKHQQTADVRVFKFCFDPLRLRSFKRELTLFRLLRSALGRRPDIATIHEVQVDAAPFYLEGEYCRNGNLAIWADAQGGIDQLPLEARIDFAAKTARAVAAAHSVGIIHKDIKPSNVLVGLQGDDPFPILTDFGIGNIHSATKLEELGLTQTGFTESVFSRTSSDGGTRLYAAPEYLVGGQPSVKGDIYALGIMLYQLVAGDLRRPLATGWRRDIDDKLLGADIEACVDVDPERRIGSATELAERLEQIPARRRKARRAAAAKTRRKWLRFAAVAAAIVAVFLVLSSVRLRESERLAQKVRQQSEDLAFYMIDEQYYKLESIGRIEILEDAMQRVAQYYADLPPEFITTDTTLRESKTLQRLGIVLRNRGDLHGAVETLRKVVGVRKRLAEAEPDNPRVIDGLGDSYDTLGVILVQLGDFEGGEEAYEEALAFRKTNVEKDPDHLGYRNRVGNVYYNLATLQKNQGKTSDAIRNFEAAIGVRQQLVEDDPENLKWPYSLAWSHYGYGLFLLAEGRLEEAAQQLGEQHRLARLLMDDNSGNMQFRQTAAAAAGSLAEMHSLLGDYQSAGSYIREGVRLKSELHKDDPKNAIWRRQLADAHRIEANLRLHEGKLDRAGESFEAALNIIEPLAQESPNDIRVLWQHGMALAGVGRVLCETGADGRAKAVLDQGGAILDGLVAQDSANTQWCTSKAVCATAALRLATLRRDRGGAATALAEAQSAFSKLRKQQPANIRVQLEQTEFFLRAAEHHLATDDSEAARESLRAATRNADNLASSAPGSPRRQQLADAAAAGIAALDSGEPWAGASAFLY